MTGNTQLNYKSSLGVDELSSGVSSYCPSVPLSVYRELVKELEVTLIKLQTLESQNQELVEENQKLRQKIDQIIESAQQIKSVVSTKNNKSNIIPQIDRKRVDINLSLKDSLNLTNLSSSSILNNQSYGVDLPKMSTSQLLQSETDGAIKGWVLATAILLIVFTSCTGAFLIVKFRLSQNNR